MKYVNAMRCNASLWSDLSEDLRGRLFAGAPVYQISAGDSIFQIRDAEPGFYRLDAGLLKVALTSSNAEERILEVLVSGTTIGDPVSLDGTSAASIVALTDCKLRFVSRTAFEQFASQNPEIYRDLAKVLAARLRKAQDTMASLAFLPVKGRVAHALLELAETLGVETRSGEVLIPRILNQAHLAAMADVSRENVNRVLSDFQRRKVVSKSCETYRIDDKAKLHREVAW